MTPSTASNLGFKFSAINNPISFVLFSTPVNSHQRVGASEIQPRFKQREGYLPGVTTPRRTSRKLFEYGRSRISIQFWFSSNIYRLKMSRSGSDGLQMMTESVGVGLDMKRVTRSTAGCLSILGTGS